MWWSEPIMEAACMHVWALCRALSAGGGVPLSDPIKYISLF
jgi:hypothetical protein